jgi:SAM-dependent methyltransferase
MKLTDFRKYLENLQMRELLEKLGDSDPETLAVTVQHFTAEEGGKRDRIVVGYFGKNGVNRIVDSITEHLLEPPKLPANAKVLDVGAGTGFLTARVAKKIQAKMPLASFYAMDLTPAMLLSLSKKNVGITPFIGIAENITGSAQCAREHFNVPLRYDAIFSTLMLHHSTRPEQVFRSIKAALKRKGKAVVLDLCEHEFEEFRAEMGDVHLGFRPQDIREMARKHFPEVKVERLAGICCKSSGRSAEIFVASMRNPV